jgi:uncharacterized membrane protein
MMAQPKVYDGIPPTWYALLVFLSGLLAIASVGGGLFGLSEHHLYHRLSHMGFDSLCHQIPSRSLSFNGVVMNVCSRCFGIYISLFAGLIVLPWVGAKRILYSRHWAIRGIVITLALIVIDFVGNLFGFWMNTTNSRILLGIVFGLSLAWLLAGELNQKPKLHSDGSTIHTTGRS